MSGAAFGAFVVAAMALALAGYSAWMLSLQRRARRWAAVPGRVQRSWLAEVELPGSESRVPAWQVRVTYAYGWKGAERAGSTVSLDPHAYRYTTRAQALRGLARWPAGAPVVVHVSPQGEPVLATGVNWERRSHALAAGVAAFLLLGVSAALVWIA